MLFSPPSELSPLRTLALRRLPREPLFQRTPAPRGPAPRCWLWARLAHPPQCWGRGSRGRARCRTELAGHGSRHKGLPFPRRSEGAGRKRARRKVSDHFMVPCPAPGLPVQEKTRNSRLAGTWRMGPPERGFGARKSLIPPQGGTVAEGAKGLAFPHTGGR